MKVRGGSRRGMRQAGARGGPGETVMAASGIVQGVKYYKYDCNCAAQVITPGVSQGEGLHCSPLLFMATLRRKTR